METIKTSTEIVWYKKIYKNIKDSIISFLKSKPENPEQLNAVGDESNGVSVRNFGIHNMPRPFMPKPIKKELNPEEIPLNKVKVDKRPIKKVSNPAISSVDKKPLTATEVKLLVKIKEKVGVKDFDIRSILKKVRMKYHNIYWHLIGLRKKGYVTVSDERKGRKTLYKLTNKKI